MNYLRNAETGAEIIVSDSGTEQETHYYKLGGDVYNWEYDSILIKASRPINDEEMMQLAGLTGYAYSVLAGEGIGMPQRVSEDSFTVWADATKCRNSNFDDFSGNLNAVISEGSPIRKTNRAGVGTKDTRKVQGMADVTVELYLDQVFSFAKK